MNNLDEYSLNALIKKRVKFNFSKQNLEFDFAQSLFSSAEVDLGTKILINSFRKNNEIKYSKILDLGCGHGVMGIFLKKQNPRADVLCLDRDFLAVDFTLHNAELNDCKLSVNGSVDYSSLLNTNEKFVKFDLIVCNFPAKAGINVLKQFVYGASHNLSSGGIFAIVIVKELISEFKSILRDEINILFEQTNKGYFVFHLKFDYKIPLLTNPYLKNNLLFKLDKKSYTINTAINVSEFESPHFITNGIIKVLKKLSSFDSVFVLNPNNGHLAIATMHYINPKSINLVSRDLLSLQFSKANLESNFKISININHMSDMSACKGDLLIWSESNNGEFKFTNLLFSQAKKAFSFILVGLAKKNFKNLLKLHKLNVSSEFEIGKFVVVLIKNN